MLFSQDPSFNQGVLSAAQKRIEKRQFVEKNVSVDLATAMGRIVDRAPHIAPELLMPLARSNVSNGALEVLNQTSAVKNATEAQQNQNDSWWQKHVVNNIDQIVELANPAEFYTALKEASQYTQALGALGSDAIPALLLSATDKISGRKSNTTQSWYQSTRFAQLQRDGFASAGTGFSLNKEFLDKQYEAAWDYRASRAGGLTKYGDPTTVGRIWSDDILGLDYTKGPGFLVSGVLDGIINVFTDPTNVAFGAGSIIKTIKAGSGALKSIRATEAAYEGYKATKAFVETETVAQAAVKESGSLINRFRLGKAAKEVPDTATEFAQIEELGTIFDERKADIANQLGMAVKDGQLTVIPGVVPYAGLSAKKATDLVSEFAKQEGLLFAAEQNVWNTSRAAELLRSDYRGVLFVAKIDNMEKGPALAYRIYKEIFKGNITLEQAEELARAVTKGESVKPILLDAFNRLNSADAVFPLSLGALTKETFLTQPKTWLNGFRLNPTPEKVTESGWVRKTFGFKPEEVLDIMGSSKQRMAAVDNFVAFVDKALPTMDYKTKLTWIEKMMNRTTWADYPVQQGVIGAVEDIAVSGGSQTAAYEIDKMVETILGMSMAARGIPGEVIDSVVKTRKLKMDTFRRYATDSAANPQDFNQVQILEQLGLLDLDQIVLDFAKQGIVLNKDEIKNIGPGLVSDLFNRVVILPDMDQITGIAQNPYFRKTFGQLTRISSGPDIGKSKPFIKKLDVAINKGWKAAILSQPAYLIRNLIDGHVRVALSGHSGLTSSIKDPTLWASWMKKQKGATDLFGRVIDMDLVDELAAKASSELSEADKTLLGVANAERWILADTGNVPHSTMARFIQDGSVSVVTKADPQQYAVGTIDQLRKISMSASEQMYARFAHIQDLDKRAEAMLQYLYTKEGMSAQQELLSLGRSGLTLGTDKGPLMSDGLIPSIGDGVYPIKGQVALETGADRTAYLKTIIQTQLSGRVHAYSEIPELRTVIMTNRIPAINPQTGRAVIFDYPFTPQIKANTINISGDPKKPESYIGGILTHMSGTQYFIEDVVIKPNAVGKNIPYVHLIELVDDEIGWATNGETQNYGDAMINFVKNFVKGTDKDVADLPQQVLHANRSLASEADKRGMIQNYIDIVFTGLYQGDSKLIASASKKLAIGRSMTALEKLPTFRMLLWDTYLKNIKSVSYDEAVRARTAVLQIAAENNMTPNSVMGGTRLQDRFGDLVKIIDRGPNSSWGKNTIEQLDQYAYALADSTMRDMFFDAATKTNFETNQFMSLAFQFASAQKTALAGLVEAMIKNPQTVLKGKRTLDAGVNADQPGPRQGFFYKDPGSGDYMYTVPLSGVMVQGFTKLMNTLSGRPNAPTGPPAGVSAPLKGINIGLQWLPSLGPIGSFGASYILPHVPGGDFVAKLFLNRGSAKGTKAVTNLIPTVVKRFANLVDADPQKVNTKFGQTYVETVLALSTTGDYDFSTPEKIESEWQRLLKDAQNPAKAITVVEMLTSFIGPSTGTTDYLLETKGGEVYLSQIASELQKLRDQDYESAIPKFLNTFGYDFMLFVSGKTEARGVEGLQFTEDFMDWQKSNDGFINKNRQVASYFGPEGDTFSWASFAYQLEKGFQYRLKPDDLKDAADYAVGASLYRAERNKYPAYLDAETQKKFTAFREGLHLRLPGYPAKPSFNPSQFPDFIDKLKIAAQDPSVSQTPIAKSITEYLNFREKILGALAEQGYPGFKSKRAWPARQQMIEKANKLIEENPEFARVYDRKLSAEVEFINEDLVVEREIAK